MAAVIRCLLLVALLGPLAKSGQFVGSKACYACHTAIYREFQKTDMGRSMTSASEWKPGVLPPEARMMQPGSGRFFSVSHNESGWQQSESEANVFTVEHGLEYAVGSGANGITFLIRRGNFLFQAPLSYYAKTKKWDFSPGYEQVDFGFNRAVPQECILCHTGRTAPKVDQPGAFADPPFPELAIGCENCHGAGGAHVQTMGKRANSILNPGKLSPRLEENICMNCHQTGDVRVLQPGKTFTDFHPGEWLIDTAVILKQSAQTGEQQESDLLEHSSAMQMSRCFRSSSGKLGCLSCHDPHVQPREAEAPGYFREKCFGCHNDRSCSLPLATRRAGDPPDNCVGCHMPKRNVSQVSHSALTNHRIPAHEGEPIPAISTRRVDDLVVVNAPEDGRTVQLTPVTLLRAYAQLSAQNPEYEHRFEVLLGKLSDRQSQDPFVQSALGQKALRENKPEDAIVHLKLALPEKDAAVDLEMGQAFAKLGRHAEAIEYLKKAVELDPYQSVSQKTLVLEYINVRAYTEARQSMERYVESFPEDSFMRNLLARVNK